MPNKVIYTFAASDKFSAAAGRIARQTAKIRQKFRKLGPAAKLAGAQVKVALAGMGRAIKGFMATALLPLVTAFAGLAGIIKFFTLGTGFQDALADLSAITFATGKDLEFLSKESLRLGKISKTSAAEVATAFKLVASAKSELLKDPKALSTVTEQVILLKNATGIGLSEAARIAVQSMNQFGVAADQANRFVNVLAAGAKVGASEVSNIGQALKNAGKVANILGLSFEETNAALQVLAQNSQEGAEAGTGLRGSMLKLNKVIPFEKVGGFTNALEKLRKMSPSVALLQKIFGEEMFKTGAILVDNTSLLRQWTKELTGTTVAQQQAEIRLGTLTAKARGLGVTIATFMIKAFNRLSPMFDEQIVKIGKFFDAITPEQVVVFANQLGSVFKIFKSLGKVVFSVLRLVSPLFEPIAAILNVTASMVEIVIGLLGKLFKLLLAVPQKLLGGLGLDVIQSLGGRISNLFGGEGGELDVTGSGTVEQKSKTDVNVNLNAPRGIIDSVKTKTSGSVSGLNVGVNMQEAVS